jgi:hydrogenase nickel incorporation protein HypA/HybF
VDGTLLQGTKLEIEVLPANGLCQNCKKVFRVIEQDGICPDCRQKNWELLSGKEFYIKEIVCF